MALYLGKLAYRKYKASKAAKEANANPTFEQLGESTNPAISSKDERGIALENQTSENGPTDVQPTVKSEEDAAAIAAAKAEKHRMTVYRWKLTIGLFFPFSVQAFDTTIIASALPFIASDFNELSQLNWIVSAFNLTGATFIPFWGQFADVFGRYAAIQSALGVLIVGAAIASGSPTNAFPVLLLGRALQGVGCAGIMILTKIILADKVSLKENARNNTLFTIVAGIGYGVGPVIGGYLTRASWRWCFIINLPIAVIGLVLVHFLLYKELLVPKPIVNSVDNTMQETRPTFTQKLATIDFVGQFFFLFGLGLLILALTWGGGYYSWNTANVIAPLVIGCVMLACFLVWEYFMMPGNSMSNKFPYQKPMIPFKLLFKRNSGLLIYLNFVTGMAMYAVFYFVDLYFALVENFDSGKAGTNLLYYTPGLGVGAYMAMFACNVYPRKTWWPLALGTLIEPLGLTILAVAIGWGNLPVVYGMLGFTGTGTGIRFMPGTLHGVAYFPHQIASIVSLMSLAINLGGTIALTVMLNIFNNKMSEAGINFNGENSSSFGAISALPQDTQSYIRETARNAIVVCFFAITAFMWLGMFAVAALGNADVAKSKKTEEAAVVDENRFADSLTRGSYVMSVIRRRKAVDPEDEAA